MCHKESDFAIELLGVAESATREWLLLRFSIIMTNRIIRSAGGGVLSRCGLMQLRTHAAEDSANHRRLWADGVENRPARHSD